MPAGLRGNPDFFELASRIPRDSADRLSRDADYADRFSRDADNADLADIRELPARPAHVVGRGRPRYLRRMDEDGNLAHLVRLHDLQVLSGHARCRKAPVVHRLFGPREFGITMISLGVGALIHSNRAEMKFSPTNTSNMGRCPVRPRRLSPRSSAVWFCRADSGHPALVAHEIRLTVSPASIAAVCPRHVEALAAGAVDGFGSSGIEHITTQRVTCALILSRLRPEMCRVSRLLARPSARRFRVLVMSRPSDCSHESPTPAAKPELEVKNNGRCEVRQEAQHPRHLGR